MTYCDFVTILLLMGFCDYFVLVPYGTAVAKSDNACFCCNLDHVLSITGWDRIVQMAAVAGAAETPLPFSHHPQLRGQLSHLLRTLTLLSVHLQ